MTESPAPPEALLSRDEVLHKHKWEVPHPVELTDGPEQWTAVAQRYMQGFAFRGGFAERAVLWPRLLRTAAVEIEDSPQEVVDFVATFEAQMELDYRRAISPAELRQWLVPECVLVTKLALQAANSRAEAGERVIYAQYISSLVLSVIVLLAPQPLPVSGLVSEDLLTVRESAVRTLIGILRPGGLLPPHSLDKSLSGLMSELKLIEKLLHVLGRGRIAFFMTDPGHMSPPNLVGFIGPVSSLYASILPAETLGVLWDLMFLDYYVASEAQEGLRGSLQAVAGAALLIAAFDRSDDIWDCTSEMELQEKLKRNLDEVVVSPRFVLRMVCTVQKFLSNTVGGPKDPQEMARRIESWHPVAAHSTP